MSQEEIRSLLERARGIPPDRKLDKKMAGEIRRRRESGERRKDLASEFGVSLWTISAICSGRIWS